MRTLIGFLALLASVILSVCILKMDLSLIGDSPRHIVDFLSRALPPDFSDFQEMLLAIIDTIAMAILGTCIGTVLSLLLGISATRAIFPRWFSLPITLLMDAIRTIPSLIWALFFVAAVGLGSLSGVFALGFYSTGYLSKMYVDDFESLNLDTFRTIRVMGASKLQAFQYGLWPYARTLILSNTIFILEYNIRTATILGVVGAGGVGYYLYLYIQQLQYPKATALLLLILPLVVFFNQLTQQLRKRLSG